MLGEYNLKNNNNNNNSRYLISYLDRCAAGQSLVLEGREVREVVCVQEVNAETVLGGLRREAAADVGMSFSGVESSRQSPTESK